MPVCMYNVYLRSAAHVDVIIPRDFRSSWVAELYRLIVWNSLPTDLKQGSVSSCLCFWRVLARLALSQQIDSRQWLTSLSWTVGSGHMAWREYLPTPNLDPLKGTMSRTAWSLFNRLISWRTRLAADMHIYMGLRRHLYVTVVPYRKYRSKSLSLAPAGFSKVGSLG